jgi:LuxR family maltose regulon positive regulatory protein
VLQKSSYYWPFDQDFDNRKVDLPVPRDYDYPNMAETEQASSKSPENLLHTKLMPPRLHSFLVPRMELLAKLDDGLERKLTCITAPTGFGKTTLVRMWLDERNYPSAWITLDENDSDPVRFWTYVITAIRTLDTTLGKAALATLMASQPPSFQSILTSLINDLTRLSQPCALVLDEYQAITSQEIHTTLSFLLQHLPENLHLVLISRGEPDLPLALLRARDELIGIDVNALRFTAGETEAFLNETLSFKPSSELATTIQERTEGWPAGLRLVVLSLQNKKNITDAEQLARSFSGSHRFIADYLINEVFETQPGRVQDFLLRTCFLDRLTASLCNAVMDSDDGASVLEQLERDNLFITQLEHGGKRTWYRYNPLFAESLLYLAKLRLNETGIQAIYEKASAWYESQGQYDDAIETAFATKSFERAMALIEKYIEIHSLTEMGTLARWLEKIPEQELFLHPQICFVYAQVILYSAADRFAPETVQRLEPFLSAAEKSWRAQGNYQGFGELLSFRGIMAWWQGDFQKAFEYARQSLDVLPEFDVMWRGNSLLIVSYEALNAGRILEAQDRILEARALLGAAQNIYGVLAAIQMLSDIFYLQGELEQSEQLYRQISIEAVGDESMLDDQGVASLGLANIAYEQNNLDRAEKSAERALELGEQRGNEMLQVEAAIRLAFIHVARHDFDRANASLKEVSVKIQNPNLLREIQEAQMRFSILMGDISSSASWLKIISTENSTLSLQREREAFTLARLWLAEGKPQEALEALNEWNTDAAENGRVRSQVSALCLEALAYQANKDTARAVQSLTSALTTGHAKDFRRIFLDEGPKMAALLQASLPSLPNRTSSLYATTLLHSFLPKATAHLTANSSKLALSAVDGVQFEALSQQEVRVLRLLVAGMSNADIAQELVVSINTVKTHVKSIYRKLNVSSRAEAREIARGLKLV